VDFIPFDGNGEKKEIEQIQLTTTYYAQLGGSRILSVSGSTDHSGADDGDVTDWVKTTEFIVAMNIWSGNKDTVSSTYKLQWQDDTDVSGYSDLGSSGELIYTLDDTSWNHGDAVATGDQKCDSQGGDTRVAGERIKGQSLSDAIDLADNEQTELWFGVDSSSADDSHQYSFQLYSTAEGSAVGICGSTITMEAGATLYYQDTGQHSMTITGAVKKKTSLPRMGNHSLTITGDLASAKRATQTVGNHSMTITGTLATLVTFKSIAGGHSLVIAGALKKKTSKSMGGHSMTITGGVVKKMFQNVGDYSLVITGALSTIYKAVQSVGEHSLTSTGSLATEKTEGGGGGGKKRRRVRIGNRIGI